MKWLAISDIHMGTPHISPDIMYNRLHRLVYPHFSSIDLLTIGGDFYDNAFYLDDRASIYGNLILNDILDSAMKYKFAIRVIRGTYTHDRDQLQMLKVFSARYPEVDIEYYDHLMLDTVKGYSFLYLPDNLPRKISDIMHDLPKDIAEYNTMHNIDKTTVDCVLGHGYFNHVLPEALIRGQYIESYDINVFKKLVDNIVVMGHVHTSSSKDDLVYYTGSFDRDRHGEEEPKGCLLIELNGKKHTVNFLCNEEATKHCTVTLTTDNVEDGIKEVKDFVSKKFGDNPTGYLRISGGELRKTIKSVIQNEYGSRLFVTDVDKMSKKMKEKTKLDFTFRSYQTDIPTRENLPNLLHDYLSKHIDDFSLDIGDISTGLSELDMRG